jgi:hypothetical protein
MSFSLIFKRYISEAEQARARRNGREIPFLEARLERLYRILLDTNATLRLKFNELERLGARFVALNQAHENVERQNRRLQERNEQLELENDMLKALHRDR